MTSSEDTRFQLDIWESRCPELLSRYEAAVVEIDRLRRSLVAIVDYRPDTLSDAEIVFLVREAAREAISR